MNYSTNNYADDDPRNTELCKLVWPAMSVVLYPADQYAILARYVREVLTQAKNALEGLTPPNANEDKLSTLMTLVRAHAGRSRDEILGQIRVQLSRPDWQTPRMIESVCFAASLGSMVRVRGFENDSTMGNGNMEQSTFWDSETSLGYTTSEVFRTDESQHPRDQPIDHKLTMSYLAVYHGYEVIWIDRLNDHLHVDRKLKTVKVFQHKIWLSAHSGATDQTFIADEIIREALDTLNLLFPHDDRKTQSFLEEREQRFYSLGYCGRDRNLSLGCYPIWGDRVQELLDIMKGRRSGFWQFLPSPHQLNILESANFWIAVFVAGLAVISFVFGLFAVIYAKESLDISRESLRLTDLQYQLSLAQACADPESAPLLPDWCPKKH